jgi:hypothetical protein
MLNSRLLEIGQTLVAGDDGARAPDLFIDALTRALPDAPPNKGSLVLPTSLSYGGIKNWTVLPSPQSKELCVPYHDTAVHDRQNGIESRRWRCVR